MAMVPSQKVNLSVDFILCLQGGKCLQRMKQSQVAAECSLQCTEERRQWDHLWRQTEALSVCASRKHARDINEPNSHVKLKASAARSCQTSPKGQELLIQHDFVSQV